MESATTSPEEKITRDPEPDSNSTRNPKSKPKIVMILGATGSGKSKLAIDLASHFPIEIINADSMQVYQGLDILTNKVPVQEQKGVPHHLLGTISPNAEFTAKDFRNSAVPLIDEIRSRNHLPVIVGGTNYYIQALVSQFLLDDYAGDLEANCSLDLPDVREQLLPRQSTARITFPAVYHKEKPDFELEPMTGNCDYTHIHLKNLDPVAANRIHPNDHRKIKQYLSLYERWGVLPSKLFQGNTVENWGRADNFKYDCCLICVDASLSALDQYVDQRVDLMVDAGLVEEVYDIYKPNSLYTRGLRQAIGVREFDDFLRYWNSECQKSSSCHEKCKKKLHEIMNSSCGDQLSFMLTKAIEKVKLNTRRLVRQQKRRLRRLQMLFGWNIQYIDVTTSISCNLDNSWAVNVVEPSVKIIKSFIDKSASLEDAKRGCEEIQLAQRDLWTQYVCQACGNKELRGAHEWEQHKQGCRHRKRVSRLRKSGISIDLPKHSCLN